MAATSLLSTSFLKPTKRWEKRKNNKKFREQILFISCILTTFEYTILFPLSAFPKFFRKEFSPFQTIQFRPWNKYYLPVCQDVRCGENMVGHMYICPTQVFEMDLPNPKLFFLKNRLLNKMRSKNQVNGINIFTGKMHCFLKYLQLI